MNTVTKHSKRMLPVLLLALSGSAAMAQTGTGSNISLGGFLGFTDRYDADFTYGVELDYRATREWGYGAIIEHTPDVIGSEGATVLLGTANFRPASIPRMKLTGGAGVEFRDYAGDNVRFRAGIGYDLFVEGNWTVTPRIAFDFGEGRNNTVLGATANYRF